MKHRKPTRKPNGRGAPSTSQRGAAPPAVWTTRYRYVGAGRGALDWRYLPAEETPSPGEIVAYDTPNGWYITNLPPGAIMARRELQPVIPAYIDVTFQCRDCRVNSLYTAVAQRQFYEEYGGYPYACASRCGDCRRQRRASIQLAAAIKQASAEPSPEADLRVARLTADSGPLVGKRARERAVALARRAARAGLDARAVLLGLGDDPDRVRESDA